MGRGPQGAPPCDSLKGKQRSEEHTSELQSRPHLVCRLLLEKKKNQQQQQQPLMPNRFLPGTTAEGTYNLAAASAAGLRELLHSTVHPPDPTLDNDSAAVADD